LLGCYSFVKSLPIVPYRGRTPEAIKGGAHSYLSKNLEASQFFHALEEIQRGQAVLPTRLAIRLIEDYWLISGILAGTYADCYLNRALDRSDTVTIEVPGL